jgi:hypothetical protein
VGSGNIGLFADPAWGGDAFWFNTSEYLEKVQASLSGTQLQDRCTWVVFELRVGTVVTLLQSVTAPVPGQPYNFAHAGSCVDLIGNGKVQTVDLSQVYANDCISAFVWRRVDLKAGVFQLFDGASWNGFGNTFFLAEWPANTVHNLQGWTVCDKAASIYFGGLGVGAVTLYDGATGNDQSAGFSGWLRGIDGSPILGANLVDRGFEDRAASWKWAPLPPVYQVVDPFSVNGTFSIDDSLSVMLNSSGSNTGGSTVQQTTKFTYTISQTATVTVTNTSTETYTQTAGFTFGQSFGIVNIASVTYEFTLNVGFSEEFTETVTETDTTIQTLASELDQVITVPENSNWTAKLLLQYAKVPPTSFTTTAAYYYQHPVPGSVLDPVMAAQLGYDILYVLRATITGYVSAGLSVNAVSTVITTPIGSSDSTTTTSTIDTVPVPAQLPG